MAENKQTLDNLIERHFPSQWTVFIIPDNLAELFKYIQKHQKNLNRRYGLEVAVVKESIKYLGDTCSGNVYFTLKTKSGERHLMFTDAFTENEARHAALDLWDDKELKKYIFPIVSVRRSIAYFGAVDTFVQEMVPSVSLYNYVKAETSLEDDVKVGISIGQALAALHSQGYTHSRRGLVSSFAVRKDAGNYSCYFANLTETGANTRQDPNGNVHDLHRLFFPRLNFSRSENFKYSGIVASILNAYLDNLRENKKEIIKILKPVFEYDKNDAVKNNPIHLEISNVLAGYEKRLKD